MAPTFIRSLFGFASVLVALSVVQAESHTISFDNKCGRGTPTLIVGGQIVSTGQPYTSGSTISGIAYLQTGECLFNGEHCTLLEMTLNNPTCTGCGSSTDISLIPPHAFNVEASFSYSGQCNGKGATCSTPNCNTAFFVPDDNQVQVQCEEPDTNLVITFCGSGSSPAPPSSPSSAKPSPTTVSSQVAQSANAAPSKAPQNVAPPPPPPSVIASPAKPAPASPSSSSSPAATSSPSSAAPATPTNNRGSCRNKRRALQARAEKEARDLYNLHRRHHARHAPGAFDRSF
ncbi:hypothetical protein BDW22DRAFT_224389 [Trametopsis cervina]|nr:hypothetical protein BDW22DRAFT_224389 [Trametopsis cervina]